MNEQQLPNFWLMIPAAGSGKRMGSEQPKQYLEIDSVTVLEWTLRPFISHRHCQGVVVALAADDAKGREICQRLNQQFDCEIVICEGGTERADSVLSGLTAIQQRGVTGDDWVLVHDAARPCLQPLEIDRLLVEAGGGIGGLLAIPVRDTLKRADSAQQCTETVDRSSLWQAQTPQMFRLNSLHQALSTALAEGLLITDEASAIELQGGKPKLVTGSATNLKITWPGDLEIAAQMLEMLKRQENLPQSSHPNDKPKPHAS